MNISDGCVGEKLEFRELLELKLVSMRLPTVLFCWDFPVISTTGDWQLGGSKNASGIKVNSSHFHCLIGQLKSNQCLQCFDTVGWVAGRASGL